MCPRGLPGPPAEADLHRPRPHPGPALPARPEAVSRRSRLRDADSPHPGGSRESGVPGPRGRSPGAQVGLGPPTPDPPDLCAFTATAAVQVGDLPGGPRRQQRQAPGHR